MTHDYKRNGTTTLFAVVDVATGKVIGECLPRHRADKFLALAKAFWRGRVFKFCDITDCVGA